MYVHTYARTYALEMGSICFNQSGYGPTNIYVITNCTALESYNTLERCAQSLEIWVFPPNILLMLE